MESEDVLNAIDQLLYETAPNEPYDPAFPGLDRGWWKQKTAEILGTEAKPAPTTRKVPTVGCVIQRSDQQQRQKQQWLTTPPPPLRPADPSPARTG